MELQRSRVLAAAVIALEEIGYAELTVAAVIDRARVSRKTFYDIFANLEECFVAVIEQISARASAVALSEYEAEDGWLPSTRAVLGRLLGLIDEEPGLARIWFLEGPTGPESVRWHQAAIVAKLAAFVERGRASGSVSEHEQSADVVAEALVGGIFHIVHSRLLRGEAERFSSLSSQVMYLLALPYLGTSRARAELRRRPPEAPAEPLRDLRGNGSLRDVKVRLTYRTIKTLSVVSERPGASNKAVAGACGVRDQGQISKLLSRLEGLSLVENRGAGQDQGGPNAWYITALGADLVRATDVHRLSVS
jgi:AcrR family transcriptional regulator